MRGAFNFSPWKAFMDTSQPNSGACTPVPASANQAFERLRLALDAGAIIGTWIWDIAHDKVTADERFAHSFGFPLQACIEGLSLIEAMAPIHPQDLAPVAKAIEHALRDRGLYRCEYRIKRLEGGYRWVEASGRVEVDADGVPVRFPGILLDIDARRTAEVARDRATALLRTFTEAVPGVVYAKDRQGRMLVANRGTTELIGKPPEFYLGKTDAEFLDDPAQAQAIIATDQRIMASGVGETIEEAVTLPNGKAAVWLSTKAPLLGDAGEVIGLIGSSVDVTARKQAQAALLELNATLEQRIKDAVHEREQAQDALRQSQKMEVVGQLTGGIAHDFNNLLAGISGCLEMLQKKLGQGRLDDLDRYVTVAQGAVQRGAALTHRLLAFSRRQVLAPRATDVNALISGMHELIQRSVGPSIDLSASGQPGLWPALIDPGQLENALLNLCVNARDAMPHGGRISISASNETVDAALGSALDLTPAEYLRICVVDDGIGMDAAIVSKVFEPFFTTKAIGEGTGLGLSMVYGFARQSGGQVNIVSTPGQGTVVELYLPRFEGQVEAATANEAMDAPAPAVGDTTVLVVEDDLAVRMLVAEVVKNLGYTLIEATDSVAGTRILKSDVPIDVLITDIGLPGGQSGLDMVNRCRDARSGLKVLFITGYAKDSAEQFGRLEPTMQVMTKPFALDALARRLRDLTEAQPMRT
jgi:PAS domain S-box-containing protein